MGGTKANAMSSFVRAEGDYYVALGIDRRAGTAEINAAFRRLAWRYHPDHNPAPDATRQFQYINEARQALADPVRRAAYDARRTSQRQAHRRTSAEPLHPHFHHHLHRRHRVHPAVLTVLAFVLTISACASLLAAVSYRHYAISNYDRDIMSFQREAPLYSRFSLEMYPVCRIDDPCLTSASWEIDLRNSWDGSSRAFTVPIVQARGSGELLDLSSRGYESRRPASDGDQL